MFKIGILGCGYWGKNYIRIFSRFKESKVVSICDKNGEIVSEISREYPAIPVFQNYHDMLNSVQMNAIVIATPPSMHFQHASQALESGLDVLLEKPMTLNHIDGENLVSLAEKNQKILMVGYTFIYNDAIHAMKSYLDSQEIGDIYYLHARRTHLGLIRPDVNTMWDLAPHDISIFVYLLNKYPERVNAVGKEYLLKNRIDVAFINLYFPGNILGNIHVSWLDSAKVREVAVVGSKMRLVFDDLNNLEKLKIYKKGVSVDRRVDDFGEFQFLLRDGDIISPKLNLNEPLKNQCSHFLECLRTRNKPITDGRLGVEITRICEAIDLSIQQHGHPVELVH
ncbi:MAG: hypothetical protein A2161_10885 [Candidatus Schekmanbacteria bacterium RBG_13_48_7]|uniref:Uncharacterized protein n=1 Tax=Candidatus Schekmanbacteria bacterium RBG_13_48_7 TaxID=1817878 RepID=A0A1F7RQJ8_9BACT|nr:MAG: hypothetical protein A2161_10885 [Candidatus Schekmanbacteria bacterium RBG_13_48_7]